MEADAAIVGAHRRSKLQVLVFALIFIALAVLIIFIIGQINEIQAPAIDDSQSENKPELLTSDYDFGISERDFAIGTAGFVPANFPKHSVSDTTNYWRLVADCCEIYGIHVNWTDTELLASAEHKLQLDFVLVLGYQTPDEWRNSRAEYLAKAKELLTDYPQIKYLAIGNEMNLEYEKDPAAFTDFIDSYEFLSRELHEFRPQLQISTVLQYEALLGEGYLTGRAHLRENELSMLAQLEASSDFVALTSYPFFDYTTPAEVPADYYSRLQSYTNLPIAITETGWVSQAELPSEYQELMTTGFNGSEDEQHEWLLRLPMLLADTNAEFVSWAFLFDITEWQTANSDEFGVFNSVGLHYNSGAPKQSWHTWSALKQVPMR